MLRDQNCKTIVETTKLTATQVFYIYAQPQLYYVPEMPIVYSRA